MIFYVYEHWRLDKNVCFYVGKGSGDRAHSRRSRSPHWRNIVAKLEREGSSYEVRIVVAELTEAEAFSVERERIAHWKDSGNLINRTDGGDGFSGGRHNEETRKRISIGSKRTAEKYREIQRVRNTGVGNPFYGKTHTPETVALIKAKLTGRKLGPRAPLTDEMKRRISETLKAKGIKPPSRKGIPYSPESRKKQSESMKARWAAKKESV